MEALVSLLILGILLTTIVSIIRFSMIMTGNSINDAAAAQDLVNELMIEEYPSSNTGLLTLSIPGIMITAEHNVLYYSEDGITAFRPN